MLAVTVVTVVTVVQVVTAVTVVTVVTVVTKKTFFFLPENQLFHQKTGNLIKL